jgi:hypothetical protein
MSILIISFGTVFGIFSLVNDIRFPVLNMQVHGAVFGAVAAFLGIRYFLSVQRLKTEVYKDSSQFSWSNFRKQKANY